ncbi:MAG: GNAT family N-acetyltransferase [Oscillospiraceae bacterium]|nr:GNAT family N-acetyltransferase [Oscillospiraceae bacterium]
MNIEYKDIHDFKKEDLQDLFLSVEWSSGHYPEKLVGLICAMDDGIMTAYVHYLLIRPEYQHMGIGKKLVEMMKEAYKDYLRVVLVAYNEELGFYESCGFEKAKDSSPMFITELWT